MKHHVILFTSFVTGIALFGAGCTSLIPSKPTTNQQPSASKGAFAFGKLPSIGETAATGASYSGKSMMVSQDASAPTAPVPATVTGGGSAGTMMAIPSVATAEVKPTSAIARPIPYPQPRPVTVEYILDAAIPAWGAEGDVLQVAKSLPDTSTVRSLAGQSGLPSQISDSVRELSSINIQWTDRDGFQWTFDAGSHNTSFWKDQIYKDTNEQSAPKLDQNAVLKAADAFLDSHGFSAIRERGGAIQDLPRIITMMKQDGSGSSMPCRAMMQNGGGAEYAVPPSAPSPAPDTNVKSAAVQGTATPDAAVEPAIYPNPCGWWPQQVSVSYANTKEGKPVSDPYGNDSVAAMITVDMRTNQVTNGNVMLDESAMRSAYPLIDQETAKRRLESGGRSPVYPWGSEGGNVTVHLKTIEVVWMRYDSWKNNAVETYYLPGLLAKGTLDRGKGFDPEDYRTIIPLLKDDVFEDSQPIAVPMMQTGSAGGGVSGSAGVISAPSAPTAVPTGKE
jgi:hypothetical protein